MPDFFDVAPPSALADARAEEAQRSVTQGAIWQGIEDSLEEQIGPALGRLAADWIAPVDPAYKLDEKTLKQLTDGVDREYWPIFEKAHSEAHANILRGFALDKTERKQRLADLGWKGQGLRIMAGLTDPAMLLTGVATGGAAPAVQAAGRAGRLAYLAKAGLVAGAPFAGLEALRAAEDPSVGPEQIALAGLSGFGFGWGHAAAGAGPWYLRGLYGGLGAAAPVAADDVLHGRDVGDILWNAGGALIMNGTFGALAPGHDPVIRDMHARVADYGRALQRDVEAADLAAVGLTVMARGAEPPAGQPVDLSPAPAAPGPSRAELMVQAREERQSILASFDAAAERLSAFAADHRLNRSEVNAVMEGTGFAAESQGFPTPEQMRFNIARLKDEATARLDAVDTYFRDQTPEAFERRATEAFAPLVEAINDGVAELDALPPEYYAAFAALPDEPSAAIRLEPPPEAAPSPAPKPGEPAKPLLTYEFNPDTGETITRPAGVEIGGGAASAAHVAAQGANLQARQAMDAEIARVNDQKLPGDIFLNAEAGTDPGAGSRFRNPVPFLRGMAETIGGSVSYAVRKLNNLIGYDPIPREGNNPATVTAYEQAEAIHRGRYGRYRGITARAFSDYVEAERAAGRKPMDERAFFEAVSKAQRRWNTPSYTADPHVDAAVKASIELHELTRAMNQRHAAPGWAEVPSDPTYVRRLKNQRAVDRAYEQYDTPHASGRYYVEELVKGAIAKRNPSWAPEIVENVARAWLDDTNGRGFETDNTKSDILAPDQRTRLITSLRSRGIDEQTIANALSDVRPAESKATTGRAMRRIPLDETHYIDTPSGRLHFEDLLVNDNRLLASSASRTGAGVSALAEIGRQLADSPETVPASIDAILAHVNQAARAEGLKPDQYARDLSWLRVMLETTMYGHRMAPHSLGGRIADILGKMLGAKYLSNIPTGLVQLNAYGDAISVAGFDATARALPEVADLWRRARNGTLDAAGARELAFFAGIAEESKAREVLDRSFYDDTAQAWLSKGQYYASKAQLYAARTSLMEPALQVMQKYASRSLQHAWYAMAHGRTAGFSARRLAGMGLTEAQADAIYAGIRKYATTKPGTGTIDAFNFERWIGKGEPEAASRLRNAIVRETGRAIGDFNPTAAPEWASAQGWKILAAFRNFMFMAVRNKTVHMLAMRDAKAFVSFVLSTAIGGSAYALSAYYKSLGRPDAQEYRDKMLSGEAIAKAAFARSDYSSFIPAVVDTFQDLRGRDPVFSFSRSSGIEGGLVRGAPLVDWSINAGKALVNLPEAVFSPDYYWSQDDMRNMENALFVPQAFNLHNLIAQWSQTLPKHSRVD